MFWLKKDRHHSLRKAFHEGDIEASKLAHQLPIESAAYKYTPGTYLSDVVLASIDGVVTTFAIVSGVAGADLSPKVLLILGSANLLAAGFSMTIGNYLGSESKMIYLQKERSRETWEVQHLPEEEEKEIYHILNEKGVSNEDLKTMMEILKRHPPLWVDFMMAEELSLIQDRGNPQHHALATFIAFTAAGSIPLIAPILGYFFDGIREYSLLISTILTFIALLSVSILQAKVTLEKWYASAIKIVFLGGVAAGVAYATGWLLNHLIGT